MSHIVIVETKDPSCEKKDIRYKNMSN
jgi:hypothetical protein